MDNQTLQLLEQDLRKYLGYLKASITNNPCAKFKLFPDLYKIIDRYIGKTLNDFIQQKFPNEYKLLSTKHTKFLIWLVYTYSKEKKDFRFILELYSCIYYVVLMNKLIRFCDDKILNLALSHLRISHQFRKYGIIDGLTKMSEVIYNKFKDQAYQRYEDFLFYRNLIYRLRTSVAQSCKRLARMYYKVKEKEGEAGIENLDNIVDNIYQHIMFYGYIPKISKCDDIYDNLKKLPYLNEDLVKSSIAEIINMVYTLPEITHQKIVTNLDKLVYSKQVLNKLGIVVNNKNLLCYVYTIIKLYRE